MNHFVLVWSVALYVESRVQGETDLSELARLTGYSLAHIRDVFRKQTGVTLSRYVQERKIANAAQRLLQTRESIIEIAVLYGYSGRDVFSRVFRQYTGYTPTEFRAERPILTQVKLAAGVNGVSLPRKKER